MNKYLLLFLSLLIPLIIYILGWLDNTVEFSYPFILGFLICLIIYFPLIKNKVKDGNPNKIEKH